MRNLIPIFVAVFALIACNNDETTQKEPKRVEKSETILKAESIHEEALKVIDETIELLHNQIDGLERRIEAYSKDSDKAEMLETYKARLAAMEAFHDEIHVLEGNFAEIPGHEHTHEEGDGHHHDHDHEKERVLEGLSDEEHLEIQQEQLNQARELQQRIKAAFRN